MTLGFGPPHRYRLQKRDDKGIEIGDELRDLWPEVPTFDTLIDNYMKKLKEIISNAPQATVGTLRQDADSLKNSFLRPLAERNSYKELRLEPKMDEMALELKTHHDQVAAVAKPDRPVSYLPSLPLQMLIVEKAAAEQKAVTKRACIVFHIGSENIGSVLLEESGELGFYTEIEETVKMFATMAESLYESASPKPSPAPA